MRTAFTLIELIVTVAIIAFLASFASLNLLSTQRKTTVFETVTTLTSDLRTQQARAMTGDTGGTGVTSDYGVYLGSNAYILFTGSSYDPNDANNYQIDLPETTNIGAVAFTGSQIVFQKGSGEVVDFNNAANTFTVSDSGNGETKTFSLNALGIITVQ